MNTEATYQNPANTVISILDSYNNGGGKTAGIWSSPDCIPASQSGYVELVESLPEAFIKATAVKYFWETNQKRASAVDDKLTYYRTGYWGLQHQKDGNAENKGSAAPIAASGSQEYFDRCEALARLQHQKVLEVCKALPKELQTTIKEELKNVPLLTAEQQKVYDELLRKERAEKEKFRPLDEIATAIVASDKKGRNAPDWMAVVQMDKSKDFYDLLVRNDSKFTQHGNTFNPVTSEVIYYFELVNKN